LVINGAAGTFPIDLSAYLPSTAKFARLTAVTMDGDSTCTNLTPLESYIGGYSDSGNFQLKYFYNLQKTGTNFWAGSGYDMDLPVSGRKLYLTKPSGCDMGSGGGMNVYVYLNGYL